MNDSVDHMPDEGQGTWVFDAEVAGVFDDMLDRSVPGYRQAMELIGKIVHREFKGAANVVDFGCSTAKAFQVIDNASPNNRNTYTGVDEAQPMLDKAVENFSKGDYHCDTVEQFSKRLSQFNPNVAILSLTLQFIPVEHRSSILADIVGSLSDGGMVFVYEKCLGSDHEIEQLWTDLYYEHKTSMGYSWDSIMQKRQSLENVLVPLTVEWNESILNREGLRVIPLLSWCNFHLWVGVKGGGR